MIACLNKLGVFASRANLPCPKTNLNRLVFKSLFSVFYFFDLDKPHISSVYFFSKKKQSPTHCGYMVI